MLTLESDFSLGIHGSLAILGKNNPSLDYYNCRIHLNYPEIRSSLAGLSKISYHGLVAGLTAKQCICQILSQHVDTLLIRGTCCLVCYRGSSSLVLYDFRKENKPCDVDWKIWRQFWQEYMNPGYPLPVLAHGPWICSSHRPNEWYYHPSADLIFPADGGRWSVL